MPRHSMCRADRQEIVIEIFFHSSSPALAQWCALKGGTSAACGGASENPTVTHSTVAGERGFSWAVPPQPNWPAGAARLGADQQRAAPPRQPRQRFFFPFLRARRAPRGGQPREFAVGPPSDQPEEREDGPPLWLHCSASWVARLVFFLFPSLLRIHRLCLRVGGGPVVLGELFLGGALLCDGCARHGIDRPSPSFCPDPAWEARGCVFRAPVARSRAVGSLGGG